MYIEQLVMSANVPGLLVGTKTFGIGPGFSDEEIRAIGNAEKSIGPEIRESLPYFVRPVPQRPEGLFWEVEEIRPVGEIDVFETPEEFIREAGAWAEFKPDAKKPKRGYLEVREPTPVGDFGNDAAIDLIEYEDLVGLDEPD